MSMTTVWLLVLIISVLVELATLGLTTIWFAGGALVALGIAALDLHIALQIALFLIVSLLLLFFTRPIAVKYFNKNRIKTNVESMAGKKAVVLEEIDNLKGTGVVSVDNREWSAKALDETKTISKGTVVEVTQVQGVKLIVKE